MIGGGLIWRAERCWVIILRNRWAKISQIRLWNWYLRPLPLRQKKMDILHGLTKGFHILNLPGPSKYLIGFSYKRHSFMIQVIFIKWFIPTKYKSFMIHPRNDAKVKDLFHFQRWHLRWLESFSLLFFYIRPRRPRRLLLMTSEFTAKTSPASTLLQPFPPSFWNDVY